MRNSFILSDEDGIKINFTKEFTADFYKENWLTEQEVSIF
jgi:hypothetical protein